MFSFKDTNPSTLLRASTFLVHLHNTFLKVIPEASNRITCRASIFILHVLKSFNPQIVTGYAAWHHPSPHFQPRLLSQFPRLGGLKDHGGLQRALAAVHRGDAAQVALPRAALRQRRVAVLEKIPSFLLLSCNAPHAKWGKPLGHPRFVPHTQNGKHWGRHRVLCPGSRFVPGTGKIR